MKHKHIIYFLLWLTAATTQAQFHTMKIPQPSPKVVETQQLGITDITVDYSSPSTRGRDVWADVINGYGDPNLAWRAGANMNTRISFSTDVTINGNHLKAGSYGFHIDAKDDTYTLMFAEHDNQWGSYYLDREKHVSLSINVKSEDCPPSEQLDYEFVNRTDSSLVIALEWSTKRIPFTVGVNVNKTVVANFRYELLGINTYRWEAWNDAAQWCLNHNTNLEEALDWANRSINGGYNGFAANKNVRNMTTKAQLLNRLGRKDELSATISEITTMEMNPGEINGLTIFLLRIQKPEPALNVLNNAVKKYPDAWFLKVNRALTYYFLDDTKKALKELVPIQSEAPEYFLPRLKQIINEVENGTYKIPG